MLHFPLLPAVLAVQDLHVSSFAKMEDSIRPRMTILICLPILFLARLLLKAATATIVSTRPYFSRLLYPSGLKIFLWPNIIITIEAREAQVPARRGSESTVWLTRAHTWTTTLG